MGRTAKSVSHRRAVLGLVTWRPACDLEALRRACPCAGCKGEVDIMGNLYKNPDKPYAPNAFELTRLGMVGGYGVQPLWADGHGTGIYAFDYLRRVAEAAAN